MLLPKYFRWAHNYPLSLDDCELREEKEFYQIISRGLRDVDAIADRYFSPCGKAKTISFNTTAARKAFKVALVVSEPQYQAILDHIEQVEKVQGHDFNDAGSSSFLTAVRACIQLIVYC